LSPSFVLIKQSYFPRFISSQLTVEQRTYGEKITIKSPELRFHNLPTLPPLPFPNNPKVKSSSLKWGFEEMNHSIRGSNKQNRTKPSQEPILVPKVRI